MKLKPVVTQLEAGGVQRVARAGSLAAIADKPPQFFPCAFVVPEGESPAAAKQMVGLYEQANSCEWLVVVMTRAANANPDLAADELEIEEGKVKDAMIDWPHPDSGGVGTTYAGARLLSVSGHVIAWALRFRSNQRIRKTA